MCEERQFTGTTVTKDGLEIPPEELIPQMNNPYIASFKNKRIVYSKDFYMVLYKLIEQGKTYVEAYQALGFDTKILGEDRANAAGKRAVKMHEEGKLNYKDSSCYEGTAPLEDIELAKLSMEEQFAYYKARTEYLEDFYEFKKKDLSEYLGITSDSILEKMMKMDTSSAISWYKNTKGKDQ